MSAFSVSTVGRARVVSITALRLLAPILALMLASCFSPRLIISRQNTRTSSGSAPTVRDLVDHVSCEIARTYENNTDSALLDEQHKNRWKHLIDGNFVAAVDLTLMVTRTEGFNPSYSAITPLTGAGVYIPSYKLVYSGSSPPQTQATNNDTLAIAFQLNSTADRNVEQDYTIDLRSLIQAYTADDVRLERVFRQHVPAVPPGAPTAAQFSDAARGAFERNFTLRGETERALADAFRAVFPKQTSDPAKYESQFLLTQLPSLYKAMIKHPIFGRFSPETQFPFCLGSTRRHPAIDRTPLTGNMELFETIDDGLTALDRASIYNIYGVSGPTSLSQIPVPGIPGAPVIAFRGAAPPSASGGAASASAAVSGGRTTFGSKVDFYITAGVGGGYSVSTLDNKINVGGSGAGGGGASGGAGSSSGGGAGGGGQLLSAVRMTQDSMTVTFGATCAAPVALAADSPEQRQKGFRLSGGLFDMQFVKLAGSQATYLPRAIESSGPPGTLRDMGWHAALAVAGDFAQPNTSVVAVDQPSGTVTLNKELKKPRHGIPQAFIPYRIASDDRIETEEGIPAVPYDYEFTITLPYPLFKDGPKAGVFSTAGSANYDSVVAFRHGKEVARGAVQWTGVVLDSTSFEFRGTVTSGLTAQPVGQIWFTQKYEGNGAHPNTIKPGVIVITHFPTDLAENLEDRPPANYWSALPQCDAITAAQKQSVIDAIGIQNQFQTFFR